MVGGGAEKAGLSIVSCQEIMTGLVSHTEDVMGWEGSALVLVVRSVLFSIVNSVSKTNSKWHSALASHSLGPETLATHCHTPRPCSSSRPPNFSFCDSSFSQ